METKDEKVLKEPFAEIGRKMHLLLHTGQLLMENGADSDRTVRDMMRTAAYLGIPKDRIHQHVKYTTLIETTTGRCAGHQLIPIVREYMANYEQKEA